MEGQPGPDYEAKATRILELKASPPPDGGRVIAFDQMGLISLRPTAGASWAVRKRPERQRARYHRLNGTRCVFGAYDVDCDRLCVRLKPRRRGSDNLAFMAQIRTAIPARRRIYWIQDAALVPAGRRTFAPCRGPQGRAGARTDLRELSQPGRVPLLPDPGARGSTTPTTSTATPSPFAWALPATATGPTATSASSSLEARHQIAA